MSRILVEQASTEGGRVLPIYLKYLRLTVLRRDMIPGQRRELTTLAHVMDRLIQRNLLGAMDIVNQRIKALELVVNGSTWGVVQHLELVPQDSERIASNAEMQSAAREFKWESKIQREITGKGGRAWGWQYRDDKGKGGKKGDGKKGASKGGKDQGGAHRLEPTKPHN